MSGSAEVNARLKGWELAVHTRLVEAMDKHIDASEKFAKSNRPWNDISGEAKDSITHKTEAKPMEIMSAVYAEGEWSVNCGGMRVAWLDSAYYWQDGRYKILERARSEGIGLLWARIRAIMKA